MKGSSELYRLVYDYYATRILFGFYVYGDALPSIPRICTRFQMAVSTVRTAFKHLEQEGYIKIEAAKVARIIYKSNSDKVKDNVANYFLPREDGLRDVGVAGQFLFEPLWETGLRQWEENDWNRLRQELISPTPGTIFMPVELYIIVLSSLENKLLLNLYWEMVRYIRFPYLSKDRQAQNHALQELSVMSNTEIIQYLKQEYIKEYTQSTEDLFSFLEQAHLEYATEQSVCIPFKWNIYHQRPQMRYSLASDIIRKIMKEHYPLGSYLPSLPQLADRYGVALSTVRRTITILVHLGVVKSYHGKGTQVCMSPRSIDLSKSDVKGILNIYLESLQLLAWTAQSISLFTLQSAPKEALKNLTRKFKQCREDKKSYLYFETFLSFIIKQCPSSMIRECYSKLNELLACGYPVTLLRLKTGNLNEEYFTALSQVEMHLKIGDFKRFSEEWGTFLANEEMQTRLYIENLPGYTNP